MIHRSDKKPFIHNYLENNYKYLKKNVLPLPTHTYKHKC